MLKDKMFMDKVSEISFAKYNGLGCNTKIIYIVLGLPGMFKSYLAQHFAVHFERINVPYNIVSYENNEDIEKQISIIFKN